MKTTKISAPLKIAAISGLFWILYQATRTYAYTYDGLCYALDVEFAPVTNLFHPNHLLYSSLNRLIYRGAVLLGYPLRAILLLQSLNALTAGLTVGLFFGILAKTLGDRRALIGAAVLGFSFTFWSEAAVDPGCYAWASLAVCLLLGLLLSAQTWPPFRVGLVCGAAVLFHQMLILVVPAFLLKLGRRKAGPYLLGVALVVGAAYGSIATIFHHGSLGEALFWALGPGGPPPDTPILSGFWWSVDLLHNAAAAWWALGHSFIAPIPGAPAWMGILGQVSLLLGVLFVIEASRRYFKGKSLSGDPLAALWVWIGVLSVFQFFFWVGALKYRLLVLPPILYLVLSLIRSEDVPAPQRQNANRAGYAAAGLLLGLMAGGNFFQVLGPQSRMENSPNFMRARWVSQTLHPDDVFLFAGGAPDSIVNVYIAYFAPHVMARSVRGYYFNHPHGDLAELRQFVWSVRQPHQRVFVEAGLYDPKIQKELEAFGQVPPGTVQTWLNSLGSRKSWIGFAPEGYKIYAVS